jgi:hypothetical protein
MSLFGELQVRLDPWQVDYGTELPLEDVEADHPDEAVVLDIELAAGEWRPVTPGETHPPSRLVFVDGVRRLEARLIIRRGERLCHGAFGSYAVGAVGVADGVATCLTPRVGHVVVVGSGESLLGSITVAPGLSYRPVSTLDSDADAPLRAIQERMRLAEERLGKELANTGDTLVIVDGPLTFEEPLRGAAVGYIKRIFKLYLPQEHLGLLAQLRSDQESGRRFSRCDRAGASCVSHGSCGWRRLPWGILSLRASRGSRSRKRLGLTPRSVLPMRPQPCFRDLSPAAGVIHAAPRICFRLVRLKQVFAVIWAMRD